jgi:hypothetical protein
MQAAEKWAIEAIFYSSVLFVAVVSSFWSWWKSQLGWTIIAKTAALTIAVFPAMLAFWLGRKEPGWLDWVSVAALWAIPPVLAWRALVLWQVQRAGTHR